METVLATLLGTVAGCLLPQRAARHDAHLAQITDHQQAVCDADVALTHALSGHHGHLYTRWQLARPEPTHKSGRPPRPTNVAVS
jgi:hypothetical protein